MGRRKKNDISGLGFLVIIVISFIAFVVQKLGLGLLIFAAVTIIIYLVYQYSTRASSDQKSIEKQLSKNESFSSSASNQGLSLRMNASPVKNKKSTGKWISQGNTVQIQGYILKNSMFYYGNNLQSINSSSPEPALIDPSLRVNRASPDSSGATMSYWPSYSNISPEARAAYLNWLSSGRNDPSTNIGYVFLFFYGLERRALHDSKEMLEARTDIPAIISEVNRLIKIYGSNGSFRGYATSFLNYLSSYSQEIQIDFIEEEPKTYGELPFSLKRTLGKLSLEGKPIPASLALSWFERCPQISLRTPAKRCRDEFIKLFEARYKSEYGEGIVINPNKTLLRCEYHPASSSFMGKTFTHELEGIPDITKLTRPISSFQKIADICMEDLEAYSRFLGRKQEKRENIIFALAQLPTEILRESKYNEIENLSSYLKSSSVQGRCQTVDISSLLSALGLPSDQPLSYSESLLAAQLLGRLGYGLEPDVRFGGNKITPSQKAVIFNLENAQSNAASPEYTFAAILLSFSSLIIHADSSVSSKEEEKLRSHVSSILSLTKGEQQRLDALLMYLCTTPPSFASVKKRIESLTSESKSFILNFLISVANADGNIDPSEIKILKKIYELFGKESNQIYSDIHAFQTTGDSPVTIASAQPASAGFAIPKKEFQQHKETGVSLNMDLVAKTLQQTHQVQSLLSNIFNEKEKTYSEQPAPQSINNNLITNLDASHSELFNRLSSLDSISVDDFQNFCRQMSVLPSGAIETINNACFDKVNDLYIDENDDILILNKEIAKEMMA